MKKFKPLLAETLEVKDFPTLRFPMAASPKLDGIRIVIIDGVVYSRNLKPIRNKYVQAKLGHEKFNGLDGEIIVGSPCDPLCYRNTNSGVMSADGEPDFKFYVFDNFLFDGGWSDRGNRAGSQFAGEDFIIGLDHTVIFNEEALVAFEEKCLAEGYEGIMLRDPNGAYKHGRSTLKEQILLKLKRFTDFEAVIVGFQERMHNANEAKTNALGQTERSMHKENMVGRGDLGALWVVTPKENFNWPTNDLEYKSLVDLIAKSVGEIDTKTKLDNYNNSLKTHCAFTVGSGFTDEERKEFWDNKEKYLGKTVKLQAFNYGGYDLPRFPTYLGLREDV